MILFVVSLSSSDGPDVYLRALGRRLPISYLGYKKKKKQQKADRHKTGFLLSLKNIIYYLPQLSQVTAHEPFIPLCIFITRVYV